MNKLLQRTLLAYRPLYLHGLLRDGQYRLPATRAAEDAASPEHAPRPGKRMLLVALTGLGRHIFTLRSKSC